MCTAKKYNKISNVTGTGPINILKTKMGVKSLQELPARTPVPPLPKSVHGGAVNKGPTIDYRYRAVITDLTPYVKNLLRFKNVEINLDF